MKKATLIYNPIAGRQHAKRQQVIRQCAAVLRGSGMEVELAPTSGPGEAEGLAVAAVTRGANLILVCGGDGTINEVINGLALSGVPLGILPAGTANILARELRIPLNPLRAARELAHWSPRSIALGRAQWGDVPTPRSDDAGEAAGASAAKRDSALPAGKGYRYYASVAGIGYDAHVVYELSPWLKLRFGVAAYVIEALRQWALYKYPTFNCRTNGRAYDATFAVVHRTSLYAGWLHIAPTANLFAPRFAVCTFPSSSRARYLLYAMAVLARQHLRLGDVHLQQGTSVVCAANRASSTVRVELDGELAGILPVTFEIVPDALTLLVPDALTLLVPTPLTLLVPDGTSGVATS